MSALARLICDEIRTGGPMSVARYMSLCLGHPQHGYYMTRDPLGRAGDFTTAPEISQLFGEMLGVWVAEVWAGMGGGAFRLIELGPGRGTLMADLRRVLARAGADPELWLVETSPVLRAAQTNRLGPVHHVDSLTDVPGGPAVVIANEFLDALPVHQFLRAGDGWRERQVGLIGEAPGWGLSAPLPGPGGAPGGWAEVSPAADAVLSAVGARLAGAPGAALFIDYGYRAADRPAGPTLQAVRAQTPADPLEAPGEADLTWLIDFDRVATALGGQVTSQGAFLTALGIGARAAALAQAHPEDAAELADALERLTRADQMGSLFKVCGAVAPGQPAPPGFAETP